MEKKKCRVKFSYVCSGSPPKNAKITGNLPELGNWNIEKSIELIKDIENPFELHSNEIELPNTIFEFKMAIINNGNIEWEQLNYTKNHIADLTNHTHVKILVREGEESVQLAVFFKEVNFYYSMYIKEIEVLIWKN